LAAFTVHEPPAPPANDLERAERLVFVKDGFNWGAFLFGPLYFLATTEWLSLAAYGVIALALSGVMALLGAGDDWVGWVMTLLNVIAGFEASELKRWSLAWRGWRQIATVTGARRDEAERRFFDAWLPTLPVAPLQPSDDPPGAAHPHPLENAKGHVSGMVHRLSASLRSKLVPKI